MLHCVPGARWLAVAGGVLLMSFAVHAAPPAAPADPFLWLENVHGARALAWVRAQDAATSHVLERDPRYAGLYRTALKIAQAKDRLAYPDRIGGRVYNFWQDAGHPRGIWRETTTASYESAAPNWTTVLDLDALARRERANWVWEGEDCRLPREDRCLLYLSDGGEDATTVREFDLRTRRFVDGGFVLPRGKQSVAWESDDTLLVAREWKPGELTASGYAYVVKRLRRGQPLSAAVEVFRGKPTDVSAFADVLHDGEGHVVSLSGRRTSFFEVLYFVLTPNGPRQLDVPPKVSAEALVGGRLVFKLDQSWNVGGTTFPAGSLVWCDLAALAADPAHLKPTLLFAPGPRESIDATSETKSSLLIELYHNVRGRVYAFTPSGTGWAMRRLELPDNSSLSVEDVSLDNDIAYLSVRSFLIPTSIWRVDATSGTVTRVKQAPDRFDASRDVVEQFEATSKDGTKVPYFVVHPKTMKLDGVNPTVLNAYGGFGISSTPYYDSIMGKLWLERGGVFALANIRGGGEFGPAWHDAGLKTHRQRVFDDFAAVAEDLIARKITSPRRLGIMGGSNGGLLMGVQFVQHPALYRAVDMQVPLLDMLRYEQIDAGASWVAEYGSVSNPTERAFLAKISPYQNLKAGVRYPVPLVWTTTKDDRVGPQQARKFAAKLASLGDPYYFYEVVEGGHGSGANQREQAHTSTLEWVYFIRRLFD